MLRVVPSLPLRLVSLAAGSAWPYAQPGSLRGALEGRAASGVSERASQSSLKQLGQGRMVEEAETM